MLETLETFQYGLTGMPDKGMGGTRRTVRDATCSYTLTCVQNVAPVPTNGGFDYRHHGGF